ncbi:MAG: 4Fe-4S binding protein [Spirochaetes bacterium]|nr:4Fe-4S binding protein [Spirochaetota bacterium]
MSEKLISLISHLFNLEEARLARHLSFIYPKTQKQIARKSGTPPDVLASLLEEMRRKRVIISVSNRFMLYPLIPGIFEHILMSDETGAWHGEYAKRTNELFDTGYLEDYFARPVNAVRSIPVLRAVETGGIIADTDLVSELIDSHTHFGVYHRCACRNAMHLTGHACRRASHMEGCLAFGEYSLGIEKEGKGRSISREELNDIVEERRSHNLVFLTSNVVPSAQTALCTCCDCCCRGLKIHNSYGGNLLAPPRAIAHIDESRCTNCGGCESACNTHAHSSVNGKHFYTQRLCIGCGNCVSACGSNAIYMKENAGYRTPSRSYARLIANVLPPVFLTGITIKLKRLFSG